MFKAKKNMIVYAVVALLIILFICSYNSVEGHRGRIVYKKKLSKAERLSRKAQKRNMTIEEFKKFRADRRKQKK